MNFPQQQGHSQNLPQNQQTRPQLAIPNAPQNFNNMPLNVNNNMFANQNGHAIPNYPQHPNPNSNVNVPNHSHNPGFPLHNHLTGRNPNINTLGHSSSPHHITGNNNYRPDGNGNGNYRPNMNSYNPNNPAVPPSTSEKSTWDRTSTKPAGPTSSKVQHEHYHYHINVDPEGNEPEPFDASIEKKHFNGHAGTPQKFSGEAHLTHAALNRFFGTSGSKSASRVQSGPQILISNFNVISTTRSTTSTSSSTTSTLKTTPLPTQRPYLQMPPSTYQSSTYPIPMLPDPAKPTSDLQFQKPRPLTLDQAALVDLLKQKNDGRFSTKVKQEAPGVEPEPSGSKYKKQYHGTSAAEILQANPEMVGYIIRKKKQKLNTMEMRASNEGIILEETDRSSHTENNNNENNGNGPYFPLGKDRRYARLVDDYESEENIRILE